MMRVDILETASLGNRGYLIHDGPLAVAVDVQRDYARWLGAANKSGATITHVFETHMHNDYVTGGYKMAQEIDAEYIVPHGSNQKFSATSARDGDFFQVGNLTITAYHTPGHTPQHMSYAISDGQKSIVCTGGGLLYGTVGRTDLISNDQTEVLTASQYDSAHKLVESLPAVTEVYPTHGFGSFCSSSDGSGAQASTLAVEAKINVAFLHEKDAFISIIIKGLGPYPRYYAHMADINKSGPGGVPQLHIHEYAPKDIASVLQKERSWVIDIRSRTAFAAQHPEAAMGIELGNSFATYTGWILPWSDTITLVGDSEEGIRTAYEELSRIGMDSFVTGATQSLGAYLKAAPVRSYERKTFSDLKASLLPNNKPFVLDVRLASEWNQGHVANSINLPLHELTDGLSTIPNDEPIWVHCASGYRASIAAGLIERSGRIPVLIDDSFENAVALQLTS